MMRKDNHEVKIQQCRIWKESLITSANLPSSRRQSRHYCQLQAVFKPASGPIIFQPFWVLRSSAHRWWGQTLYWIRKIIGCGAWLKIQQNLWNVLKLVVSRGGAHRGGALSQCLTLEYARLRRDGMTHRARDVALAQVPCVTRTTSVNLVHRQHY